MPERTAPPALRISRDAAGLDLIAGWADEVVGALGLGRRPAYALRLCLEEAVANLVMHARPLADGACDVLDLQAAAEAEGCVLIVRDRCVPFDPVTPTDRVPPMALANDRVGGAGLHLLRHFAATIAYDNHPGGNTLTIHIAGSATL